MKKHNHHKKSILKLGLLTSISVVWLTIRTGTKPSRIAYPCQKAAVANVNIFLASLALPLMGLNTKTIVRHVLGRRARTRTVLITTAMLFVVGASALTVVAPPIVNLAPVILNLEPHQALVSSGSSDLFIVQNASGLQGNMDAAISSLVTLMQNHNLMFYKTATYPLGLIGRNDVVIIKVNGQSPQRGGTNTDLAKSLVKEILSHPEGFMGEIVLADNGQSSGGINMTQSNAYDHTQSMADVAQMFSASDYKVSSYSWYEIANKNVNEYADGDFTDGYVVNSTANAVTGLLVSYPKFRTADGTYISFKRGIWNQSTSSYDSEKLKVINLPLFKSHYDYGATACVKNYMGVGSQTLTGEHDTVGNGGMGTQMVETRFPVLNILDCIWINANPYESGSSCGPFTSYDVASYTNLIGASTDPVALEYWIAKHVAMPTAIQRGYSVYSSINPDYAPVVSGLTQSYHNYLTLSMNVIKNSGRQATMLESAMNVYLIPRAALPVFGLNHNYFKGSYVFWNNSVWWQKLRASGTEWIRTEIRYFNQTIYLQNQSDIRLNLEPLNVCRTAKANGFKILAVLDEKINQYKGGGSTEVEPIEDLETWKVLVKGVLDGYGNLMDAVEMWNEPDRVNSTIPNEEQWYMNGSASAYLEMLKILYQEVQNYNMANSTSIKVVAGALSSVKTGNSTSGSNRYGGYLLGNLTAMNASSYCDYFSIHIYDGNLDENFTSAADLYNEAKRIIAPWSDNPVWITELGANQKKQTEGDANLSELEIGQREFMRESLSVLQENTDCPLTMWYCYYNPHTEGYNATENKTEPPHGIVSQDANLTERLAYFLFQSFVRGLGRPSVSITPNSVAMDLEQSQLFNSTVSGGTSPYSYQWCLNDSPISGATNPTWIFAPPSPGSYNVYLNVTDNVGYKAESNFVLVTVNPPPSVTISPVSVTMGVNQSQPFNSTVSGGALPYSYQWFLNGTAVPSANSSSWTFAPPSAGRYTIYANVTDSLGVQATSNNANITVGSGVHNVAVTNVLVLKTIIGQGYGENIIATAADLGSYRETFNLTLCANTTIIASQNVTLSAGDSENLTITWNTTGFAFGNYTINATAGPVPGETDTGDNTFTDAAILVTIPGDINGDFNSTRGDLVLLANAYGSKPQTPSKWNPNADINGNGVVGLTDLVLLAIHYGQHYP